MTTSDYFDVARPGRPAALNPGFSTPDFRTPAVALVDAAWRRYRTWRRLRRAVRELNALDDRMLKDIGISRSTVYTSARDGLDADGPGYGLH